MTSRGSTERRGTERSTDRRQALVTVAAELFARQGFRSTTVRQIAESAGVLSGSLYHHFDSKEASLDSLLTKYFDELLANYRQVALRATTPPEALWQLIEIAVNSLAKHRAAVLVLHNEQRELALSPRFAYLQGFEKEIRALWVRVLESGIAGGDLRDDLDPRLVYQVIRDAISVAVRWYQPDGETPLDELIVHYRRMLNGISTEEGP